MAKEIDDRKKKSKVVGFLKTFILVALALTAFWIFFDWFNCTVVKKEAFEFALVRHIIMPCGLALAYTFVMQTKVFGKDDDDEE